ncbi:hypothetical protein PVAP13_5KG693150 [Panicum virgatum]|uniref:Pectin acetylesterase n=1 Tax=Panicum virgatum TaxID=38727 RepID=A0A8T0SWJ6_PANVG|nr:hypothetical protein PVAP13_5KG693150 [Panicum virgatum]
MGHHLLGMQRVKIRMEPNFSSEDCTSGKQLLMNSWQKEWTLLRDSGRIYLEKGPCGRSSMQFHLQNVREALPKGCLANKDPTEIRNALAPNGSYPGQAWSSCKADIRNCSSTQIDVLHGFRKKLVSELKVAEDKRDWGLFIDSCFTHCQSPFRISWISPDSPILGNKTIAEAVGDWYFGRREEVKYIDCKYPCNPTCSSRLPTA